jgi:hypothetical protein
VYNGCRRSTGVLVYRSITGVMVVQLYWGSTGLLGSKKVHVYRSSKRVHGCRFSTGEQEYRYVTGVLFA